MDHQNKQKNTDEPSTAHQPVLLQEVLTYLRPQQGEAYLDVTAGYAGHASAVQEITAAPEKVTLVDRDAMAVEKLQKVMPKAEITHSDFLSASKTLQSEGKQYDMILADLGVSSPHLDNASRGFSFQTEAPLDMRMDNRQSLTAADIVNTYDEAAISDILWKYGEEPKSRQISRMIVQARPLKTTTELARVVARAWPGKSKTHPATRTFQALRIAVNDELTMLEEAIPIWISLLTPGGRLAIISFHSLEDRIIKKIFQEKSIGYEAEIVLLTKRPITGSAEELVSNPRARSAKLRVAVKQKYGERQNSADQERGIH